MKTFKRIQSVLAAISMWIAIAISNNSEATGKEILACAMLAALAGMVIISVLIEREKEEIK